MDNLEEVINAFARLIESKRNPLHALQDLAEKLDKHGIKALREWDEYKQHEQELEGENAELRRRLNAAGLNHRIGEDVAA